ncbi:MAG: DUF4440 domain-containing protein [Gemmatimonadetes bacterium]|nr:DUF4440 domain-containing protein [Gemmatimonadota bacterium]
MDRRFPLIAALLTAAIACTTTDGANTAADVEALRSLIAQEVEALTTLDADALTAVWADDILIAPPNEPAVSGEAAVEWAQAFTVLFSAIEGGYMDEEIVVSGDWAIHTYGLEMSLTLADGGDSTTERGRGIHIFRREADGSWKMVHDIWNFEAPAEGM